MSRRREEIERHMDDPTAEMAFVEAYVLQHLQRPQVDGPYQGNRAARLRSAGAFLTMEALEVWEGMRSTLLNPSSKEILG